MSLINKLVYLHILKHKWLDPHPFDWVVIKDKIYTPGEAAGVFLKKYRL